MANMRIDIMDVATISSINEKLGRALTKPE